ncbi:MAG: DUF1273 domain-containing protein [Ruminococcaceae bacterium]|nr:DUF1273 domain-containing protein [Oscillospiraceae bacterium]
MIVERDEELFDELTEEDLFDDSVTAVCFTGHREIQENVVPVLKALLAEVLDSLYDRGARVFKAGGALGFDTMAAAAVIDLRARKKDRGVKLCLCLPAPDQDKYFSRFDATVYRIIKENSYEVTYVSDRCTRESYLARNRKLLEGSDVCVAYCTKQKGGSYYTCKRAIMGGLEFINLADFIEYE